MLRKKNSESKEKHEIINHDYILSQENVNMGHQPELDYIKALCILLIVTQHIYENFSYDSYYMIIYILSCTITPATTLMLLMGIGMKYTRHNEIKNYVARGFTLLTMAQYLYLISFTLPNLFVWWATGNKVNLSRALLILQTDILTFAGFSFLFLALMKTLKLSDNFILIISVLMNITASFLRKIIKSTNNYILNIFLGYFVLTDAEAYFPFCGYFIFAALGYWIGGIYQRISNKDKFYNLILIFCLPTVIIFHYFGFFDKIQNLLQLTLLECFCLMPIPFAIVFCMCTFIYLVIFYKIDKMLKGKTPRFITHLGKNLNQYYFISYVITVQTSIFLKVTKGEKYPSEMKQGTFYSFILIIICRIIIDINDKYIHFTITNLKNPMRNYVFAFIWILTFISFICIYQKVEVYANIWNNYLNET